MNMNWTRAMVAVLPLMGVLGPMAAANKHWLGPMAAGLGLSLGPAEARAGDDHLKLKQVSSGRVSSNDGKTMVSVRLETAGDIPMDGKAGAFGYAALSDGSNNVLVLATHLPIDDSLREAAGSGFHAHVLDLKAPTPACAGATFEVDVESSKRNPAFDADYYWTSKGRIIEARNIPAADLGDAGLESFAAFKLKPVLGTGGDPIHQCVVVVDQT